MSSGTFAYRVEEGLLLLLFTAILLLALSFLLAAVLLGAVLILGVLLTAVLLACFLSGLVCLLVTSLAIFLIASLSVLLVAGLSIVLGTFLFYGFLLFRVLSRDICAEREEARCGEDELLHIRFTV